MSSLVLSLTPLALATVVSPLVFMSLFVVLGGDRPLVQGLTFVAGLGAAVGATAAVSALVLGRRVGHVSAGGRGIAWLDLVLGLCEVGSGVWLWFRGAPPGQVTMPKVITRLQRAPLPVVLIVGIAVPTYPAAVAAGSILLRSDMAADSRGWAVVTYMGVCSIVVAVPLLVVVLVGSSAQRAVRNATEWLLQRSSTVGAAVLVLVGGYLAVSALVPAG